MSYADKIQYKQAVWQYIIDHSLPQKDGYMRILFYVKDKADFDKRVMYRLRGFKRYDDEDTKARCKERLEEFNKYKQYHTAQSHIATCRHEIATKIDATGTLKDRIILWAYRKTRDYLFYENRT